MLCLPYGRLGSSAGLLSLFVYLYLPYLSLIFICKRADRPRSSFIHLANYLFTIYYVPGTILGPEDTIWIKTKSLFSWSFCLFFKIDLFFLG